MKVGKVRIIGGKWRSRSLAFPSVGALRPTPDAVRETLFNWLSPYLNGLNCLDCYAGSGALGFEAVSRGAAGAILVEKNPKVVKALRANQGMIDKLGQMSVTQCAALQYISTATSIFDLIFLDPPFAGDELEKACYQIEKRGLIAPQGLIYIEQPKEVDLRYFPLGWLELKSAQRGGVNYALFQNTLTK